MTGPYYIPPEDIRCENLSPGTGGRFCEFKGSAVYWHVRVVESLAENAVWSYLGEPSPPYAALRDHLAFYAARVDGHKVQPQPGGFYGVWVTPDILGPFNLNPAVGVTQNRIDS